jgi:hypothetical protein
LPNLDVEKQCGVLWRTNVMVFTSADIAVVMAAT